MTIFVGARKRLRVTFRDDEGAYIDPDSVTFRIRTPEGVFSTHVYGTSAVVRENVGRYYLNITLPLSGVWAYTALGPVGSLGGATLTASEQLTVVAPFA